MKAAVRKRDLGELAESADVESVGCSRWCLSQEDAGIVLRSQEKNDGVGMENSF